MRPDEVLALGELAGDAAGGAGARIHDMHAGIAERVFRSIGPSAEPVQVVHDSIAGGVYAAVSRGTSAALRAGAAGIGAATTRDSPSIAATVRGRVVVGALNGAFGDLLERRGSALSQPLTLRRRGRDVLGAGDALAGAGPKLAIFIHGLCETDDAWRLRAAQHTPYGDRLETELGYTSLYVVYNSGRHISENGRELASVLEQAVERWPVPVQEIALIGHSMGGLVARSACHYGFSHAWSGKVRHVFMLGCPNTGAPLERAANAASSALARLPETRGIARALNLRSAGIKDLRYGYVIDEDWFGHDADAFLRNTGRSIPFLESANHYFVAAALSRAADGALGRVIGDLLVLRASAWGHGGRGERMRFAVDNYSHIGGASHFDLLNHPAIYAQIRRWLTGRPALPALCEAAH